VVIDFTLPELGENIETGDVVQVLVKSGDVIKTDQPVLELETDKATIEVPAPAGGTVGRVAVKEGETVAVGQLLLTIETAESTPSTAPDRADGLSASAPPAPSEPVETVEPVEPAESGPPASGGTPPTAEASPISPVEPAATAGVPTRPSRTTLASPSVRRLAREFGADIGDVPGSGARGRVSADDVKAYARRVLQATRDGSTATTSEPELPDFTKWGSVERTRMRSIRRATVRQMSRAWQTIPHVTQHDRADVTQFESVRKRLKKESPDIPLTVTAFTVMALAAALKKFPQFNASLDVPREEIVYKQYINIGVAVDTDRGLLVPVIRDADKKTLIQISLEIAALAEKARSKAVTLDEMQGGTFTVTNLGGLGGTLFTPIINHPEVAILGLSRSTYVPVLVNQQFEPRLMMPLSLSYDHRLIDGADAVRFVRWVAERIEQPLLLSLVDL
jgi:pyruvate dehydrogenase E2 component (dihydrolipoamide acetyltransferase)